MIGEWGPTTVRTVDLDYHNLLMIEGRPGTLVRVLYGGVWLTEEGCLQDVFATRGEEVALKSRGKALLEGLGSARVQVVEPLRASFRSTLNAWVRRAARVLAHQRPAPRCPGAGPC